MYSDRLHNWTVWRYEVDDTAVEEVTLDRFKYISNQANLAKANRVTEILRKSEQVYS